MKAICIDLRNCFQIINDIRTSTSSMWGHLNPQKWQDLGKLLIG